MNPVSADRRAAARIQPRRAARTVSRPGRPVCRITTVTRISCAGMLPKHANGKISHVALFWELTMPLGKLFFRGRSRFAHASPYAAAEADAAPAEQSRILHLQFGARGIDLGRISGLQASADGPQRVSSQARPLRAILAAGSGLMLKAMAWCGGCADLAFANFPIGIMSWIVAQAFAGCAAYAEAMYPTAAYAVDNDDADRRDPALDRPRQRDCSTRSPGLAPELREPSRFAADDGGKPFAVSGGGRIAIHCDRPRCLRKNRAAERDAASPLGAARLHHRDRGRMAVETALAERREPGDGRAGAIQPSRAAQRWAAAVALGVRGRICLGRWNHGRRPCVGDIT
jgi:hypothetical protein